MSAGLRFPSWARPVAAAVLLLSGLAGCKHSDRRSSTEESVPSDLKIVVGLQGVHGGRATGYSLDASGEVTRWTGLHPGQHVSQRAVTETDQVLRLWRHAQRIDFLEMEDQVMAQTYHFISVTANGQSRTVTFIAGATDSPSSAQALFHEAMAVARRALGEAGSDLEDS